MSDITTSDPFGGNGGSPTMSSREIAERTGKEHKNVIRDVRGMLTALYGEEAAERTMPERRRNRHREFCGENAGAILDAVVRDGSERSHHETDPTFPGVAWERDSRGYVSVVSLDKSHTLTLVAGYDARLRKSIIDRWQELEEAATRPEINVRDMGQLTTIALQLIEVNKGLTDRAETAERQIEADKPKTTFFDRFVNAEGLYGLQNCGRALDEPPNKFVGGLKKDYLFYQGGSLVPYQRFRAMGIFEVKCEMVDEKARYWTYITPKGVSYFAKKLGKLDPFGGPPA